MNLRKLAWLAALLVAATAVAGNDYKTYINERYGYRIAYPADFQPQGVPDAGDGQTFRSPSGDAELRVFASACVDGLNATPRQYLAHHRKAQHAGRQTLMYQRAGDDFAVVSGHRKQRVFYDKLVIRDDWCTQFGFEYSEHQAAKYDAATKYISSSLKQ